MINQRGTDVIALKKIMVEQDLEKISKLSQIAGISRSTLGNILSGKTQPSADVMHKLVATLKIPPEKAGEIFFNHDLRIA